MSMLRPVFSVAGRSSAVKPNQATRRAGIQATRTFATQSGDDVEPPTALAKLYLEDGTTLTAKSFGCHTSVEGEVRPPENGDICVYFRCFGGTYVGFCAPKWNIICVIFCVICLILLEYMA